MGVKRYIQKEFDESNCDYECRALHKPERDRYNEKKISGIICWDAGYHWQRSEKVTELHSMGGYVFYLSGKGSILFIQDENTSLLERTIKEKKQRVLYGKNSNIHRYMGNVHGVTQVLDYGLQVRKSEVQSRYYCYIIAEWFLLILFYLSV